MTLPEVLISVVLTGVLVTSMAMSITVIGKQRDNSAGRLNNARSEQNVGIWMPADLASAEVVSTDASASPCGTMCPAGINVGGSNALMLTWSGSTVIDVAGTPTSVPTETKVSYRYVQEADEWMLIRVECITVNGGAPTCQQTTVLHDLDPPPPGVTWTPGFTEPDWVMVVSQALDPADVDGSMAAPLDDPTYKDKNGQRVVVTINGGGDIAGIGGGTNQISLSAGGTERQQDLDPNAAAFAPTFTAARSRCGGNYGMLIDTSGSIGSTNMSTVRTAITAFINAFAGTPVKLQLVDFDTKARTLGGDVTTGARYFDMLKDTDVADLKVFVSGGTTSTGTVAVQLTSGGYTNWEDGLNRMFRKSDGAIQTSLPKTMIFFTDGEPTFTRMGNGSTTGTSMSPTPTVHPDDTALTEVADGGDYAQVAFNRANRIAREFGVQVDYIGVFVGAATNASNDYVNTNVGYHLENFEKGYHHVYERGYHDGYERGNNVVWERGFHAGTYERGNNVIWERGYRVTGYERAGSGLTYERLDAGIWGPTSRGSYESNNTVPGDSDGWRARVSGSLSGWTSTSSSNYTKSNQTSDSTDGFRQIKSYTSPYSAWESTTQSTYNSNNSNSSASDGWRTRQTSPSTSWTSVSSSEYNASNTTSDATDGWRTSNAYTAPFSSWESTTQATYTTNNVSSGETDGWRTRQTSSSSSWTTVSATEYNLSNTTGDSTDGWRTVRSYTSPYSAWESSTQSSYDAGNTGSDETDGWRTYVSYTSPYSLWEPTDEATYLANNTSSDPTSGSDGYRATKVYLPPYTGYDATQTISMLNKDILGLLIDPAGIIDPEDVNPADGIVDNPQTANMYATEDWAQLQGSLTAIALGECGGTLTLQTKLTSGVNASDPFVYQNSIDSTVVETSAVKRSGTFDFPLSGGGSITVQITPQALSNLNHYSPGGWSCKVAGTAIIPTPLDIPDTPWDGIELTISANEAVSCVQSVIWVP